MAAPHCFPRRRRGADGNQPLQQLHNRRIGVDRGRRRSVRAPAPSFRRERIRPLFLQRRDQVPQGDDQSLRGRGEEDRRRHERLRPLRRRDRRRLLRRETRAGGRSDGQERRGRQRRRRAEGRGHFGEARFARRPGARRRRLVDRPTQRRRRAQNGDRPVGDGDRRRAHRRDRPSCHLRLPARSRIADRLRDHRGGSRASWR